MLDKPILGLTSDKHVFGLGINQLMFIVRSTMCVVNSVLALDRNQTGVMFCVADLDTGAPLFKCVLGTLTVAEIKEYTTFALEKAERLAGHPEHVASSQSRNVILEPRKYGGAVRGKDYLYSFSGFTEDEDEAAGLALLIMWYMRDLPEKFRPIAADNLFFKTLKSHLGL